MAVILFRPRRLLSIMKSTEGQSKKRLCREYEVTHKAVPDHHLNLSGYFGEAILRALVSANLITREREDRFALYGYKPTELGLKYYKAMLDEKNI